MSRIRIPLITRRQRRTESLSPVRVLWWMGAPGWTFQIGSLISLTWCVALWIKAKTVDQAERDHAERRALYVGLWTPTLYAVGATLERQNG